MSLFIKFFIALSISISFIGCGEESSASIEKRVKFEQAITAAQFDLNKQEKEELISEIASLYVFAVDAITSPEVVFCSAGDISSVTMGDDLKNLASVAYFESCSSEDEFGIFSGNIDVDFIDGVEYTSILGTLSFNGSEYELNLYSSEEGFIEGRINGSPFGIKKPN